MLELIDPLIPSSWTVTRDQHLYSRPHEIIQVRKHLSLVANSLYLVHMLMLSTAG